MSRESCVHTPDTCIRTYAGKSPSFCAISARNIPGGRATAYPVPVYICGCHTVSVHTNSTGFGHFCHFPRTLTMLTTECMITSKTVPYVSKLGPKFKRWALQQLLLGPTQVINAIRMRPARCSVSAHIP